MQCSCLPSVCECLFLQIQMNREVCKAGYLQQKSRLKPLKKSQCLPAQFVVFCVHDDRVPLLETYKNEKDMRRHEPESLVDMINCHFVTSALEDGRSFLVGLPDLTLELVAQNESEKNDWIHLLTYKLTAMNCLTPDTNPYVPLPRLNANSAPVEMPLISIDTDLPGGGFSSVSPRSIAAMRTSSLAMRSPLARRITTVSTVPRLRAQSPPVANVSSVPLVEEPLNAYDILAGTRGELPSRSKSDCGEGHSAATNESPVEYSSVQKPPPLPPRKPKGRSFSTHDTSLAAAVVIPEIVAVPTVMAPPPPTPSPMPEAFDPLASPLLTDIGQLVYDILTPRVPITTRAGDFYESIQDRSHGAESIQVQPLTPGYNMLPTEQRDSDNVSPQQCYDTLAGLHDTQWPVASSTRQNKSSVLDRSVPLPPLQSPSELYNTFSQMSSPPTGADLLRGYAVPPPESAVDSPHKSTTKIRTISVASSIQLDDYVGEIISPPMVSTSLGPVVEDLVQQDTTHRVFEWLTDGAKSNGQQSETSETTPTAPDTSVPPVLHTRVPPKPAARPRVAAVPPVSVPLPSPTVEGLTLESIPPVPPRNPLHSALDSRSVRAAEVETLQREIDTTEGLKLQLRQSDVARVAFVEIRGSIWVAGWMSVANHKIKGNLHVGDRLIAVNSNPLSSVKRVEQTVNSAAGSTVELIVRRLPLCQVFLLKRSTEGQNLGIVRDGGTSVIASVVGNEPADLAGLSATTKGFMNETEMVRWCITEVNNRPISLSSKKNEAGQLLNAVGKEVSLVVQPTDFVKELKKQLKASKKRYEDYLLS